MLLLLRRRSSAQKQNAVATRRGCWSAAWNSSATPRRANFGARGPDPGTAAGEGSLGAAIRARVELVEVGCTVIAPDGTQVRGLTRDDFSRARGWRRAADRVVRRGGNACQHRLAARRQPQHLPRAGRDARGRSFAGAFAWTRGRGRRREPSPTRPTCCFRFRETERCSRMPWHPRRSRWSPTAHSRSSIRLFTSRRTSFSATAPAQGHRASDRRRGQRPGPDAGTRQHAGAAGYSQSAGV